MVVGAFPIAKLGALFIRHISKPIANIAKERAKKNYFFRTYVCMPPAQFYHWCEVTLKMWAMNLGKPAKIPSLNEAMAIELGANLLGEGIIFGIAAVFLVNDYIRSSRKEREKEEAKVTEMSDLKRNIQELGMKTEKQRAQIRELVRLIHVIDQGQKVPNDPPIFHEDDSSDKNNNLDVQSKPNIVTDAVNFIQALRHVTN